MTDEGCTQTNEAEVLLPDQSLIPTAQELTTFSSVSHDQPTLQTVNPYRSVNDGFTRTIELSGSTVLQLPSGDQAAAVAATGNSQDYYIPESPPHVAIQMEHDQNPLQSGGQISATMTSSSRTNTSTAGPRHVTNGISITNSIAAQSFQLGNTFLGLAFQAAVALLVFRLQPQGDSTPSSFLFNMVGATMVCGFTLTLIGMLLRRAHSTVANISGHAGVLSVSLGFFLMMEMYIPERFRWSVWTAAGILLLAFAYSIALFVRGTCI